MGASGPLRGRVVPRCARARRRARHIAHADAERTTQSSLQRLLPVRLLNYIMAMRAATLISMYTAAAGQQAPGKIEATCHFNATTQDVEGGGISSGTMYITYIPGLGATTDVITEGMTPGLHGIHIHDFGDLSDTVAGTSTGPHYNPLDEIVRPRQNWAAIALLHR